MSERLYATVYPLTGAAATPVTSLQVLNAGIGKLESDAIRKGVKPIWDSLEIETDEEQTEDGTLGGPTSVTTTRWFTLSVLTITPEEVG